MSEELPYLNVDDDPNAGRGNRIDKLNSLVQQEVAAILAREVEWPRSVFVTVSRVQVADDAESAKVWMSVMPATHEQDALNIVTKKIADIQHILDKRLHMKFVPKLTFLIDDSGERAAKINRVLDLMASNDLGLSLDAEQVEKERLEREKRKGPTLPAPGADTGPDV